MSPALWCEFPKNKAVFTAIAPITIEINATFLHGWRQRRPQFFFSFYLWGWVLSLLCKITSILCILQCQLYNSFGGYLGCFPSLHSGFGLFGIPKKMKSCAYFCFILADKSSCALSTPVPSPPTLTLFAGHLGCVSSLNSGFGLVWNTKYEVFCLFLF